MILRSIKTSDIFVVQEIERQCFGYNKADANEFARWLDGPHGGGLVAVIGGHMGSKIAGYLLHATFLAKGFTRLLQIAVTPEQRRKGIARSMVGLFTANAIKAGLQPTSHVPEYDTNAQLLLRSCDWYCTTVEHARFRHPDHGFQDAYVFTFDAHEVSTEGQPLQSAQEDWR